MIERCDSCLHITEVSFITSLYSTSSSVTEPGYYLCPKCEADQDRLSEEFERIMENKQL